MPISLKAKASKRLIIWGICAACVCACVCVWGRERESLQYVAGTPANKAAARPECMKPCVCAGFIFSFTSPGFHFPLKSFCCHPHHLPHLLPHLSAALPEKCAAHGERSEGMVKRVREDGRRGEDCSWLAAVCVLWIAFEFKGNAAFLTVRQNKRSNVMQ